MGIFESVLANFARVDDEVTDCTAVGVVGICFYPASM
jgi:hypothetical protein